MSVNVADLEKALELLVYGWGGVFLVIGIIYLASKLLGKAFPQNK
ncbi:OadG-related small transporter subunit [Floricoccus tropicus]|nr:OadG-related small transporter subunit [Floricoccus tropicus]